MPMAVGELLLMLMLVCAVTAVGDDDSVASKERSLLLALKNSELVHEQLLRICNLGDVEDDM